jgi:fructoselysine 6-kinase
MIRVLGLGDNVCDVYLHTKTMYPGGQALNVAVFSKRLGAHAEYLGAFGSDPMAVHIQKTLNHLEIPFPRCRQYQGENGYAKVSLVDGERIFIGSNQGGPLQSHPLRLEQDDLQYIAGFDLVHTSNNSFLDDQLPKLAKLPCLVSYDFSYRWCEDDRVKRVCPYVDFAFLSCGGSDSLQEVKEVCQKIHREGASVVVATMGKQGALLFDGDAFYRQPSEQTPAVDTLGAGDSFAACTLVEIVGAIKQLGKDTWNHSINRKEILTRALNKAASFATEVCQMNGAFNHGIPVPLEIEERIFHRRETNAP